VSALSIIPVTEQAGEQLGPAFATLVETEGLAAAWDILEEVRRDGTDTYAAERNMDAHGCWLWSMPGMSQSLAFHPYPAH
jgi:hypothetical protein